jgi:hypothetical protein
MERYERIFNWVGWFGFLLLVPVGFYIFDFRPAVALMQSHLGLLGNPSFLTLFAFTLILLRIIFGGGYIIMPLITCFIMAFFLMFTVVEVGFMRWFRLFARDIFFLRNLHLNFLVACGVLLTGVILSYFKKLSGKLQLVLLVLLPVLFLIVCAFFDLFQFPNPIRLSVDEGLKGFLEWIDEEYRYEPEVRQYVENINDDRDLSILEKEEKIRRFYRDLFMAVDGRVDPDGDRRLSLDWVLGEYTCASEHREIVCYSMIR